MIFGYSLHISWLEFGRQQIHKMKNMLFNSQKPFYNFWEHCCSCTRCNSRLDCISKERICMHLHKSEKTENRTFSDVLTIIAIYGVVHLAWSSFDDFLANMLAIAWQSSRSKSSTTASGAFSQCIYFALNCW